MSNLLVTQKGKKTELYGLEELSDQLKTYLLNIKSPKVFKLAGVGDKVQSIKGNDDEPIINHYGGSFLGETYIRDPYNGFQKVQILVTNGIPVQKNIGGALTLVEEPTYIEVPSTGYIVVKPQEKQKLAFFLFNNFNGSYKYRDETAPILWYEIKQMSGHTRTETNAMLLIGEAMRKISNMSISQLIEVSTKLSNGNAALNPNGKKSDDIRYDLMVYAKENPRAVIEHMSDIELKNELMVKDAVALQILTFDIKTKAWYLRGLQDPIYICQAYIDGNEEEELLKFIKDKEGKKIIPKIEQELKIDDI